MKMTQAGLELIKAYEGLGLKAYLCPANKWTIGYGHTTEAGHPVVHQGMTITKDEAERILRSDLVVFEEVVKRLVTVELNDNQFSALVSFVFNVGETNFAKSSVLKSVNSKKFKDVPANLAKWNKARVNGELKVLPGLVKRRAEEAALFMGPPAQDTVKPKSNWLDIILKFISALRRTK